MPETTDCNLKKWFLDRGLPWSDKITTDFVEKGIECVEDLLSSEDFYFKRQAKRINQASEEDTDTPSPSAAKNSKMSSRSMRDNEVAPDLRKHIPVISKKTKEEMMAEQLAIARAKIKNKLRSCEISNKTSKNPMFIVSKT